MFFLLCKRLLEVHFLVGDRVSEPEFGSVEHQAAVAMRVTETIELVTKDGASQPIGVGAMNAELVGAAGMWVEGYEVVAEKFVVGNSALAVLHVDNLSWPVHGVWA